MLPKSSLSKCDKEVRLGVLLPMTGYWPMGTRIAAAAVMVTDDVTKDQTLLPGCNITYEIWNSACVLEKGLRGMERFRAVDAFIGPACSTVTEASALQAKIWGRPMLTYAASSKKFIDKKTFSTLATLTAYGRRNEFYTPK